jgi:hypothetical protein
MDFRPVSKLFKSRLQANEYRRCKPGFRPDIHTQPSLHLCVCVAYIKLTPTMDGKINISILFGGRGTVTTQAESHGRIRVKTNFRLRPPIFI